MRTLIERCIALLLVVAMPTGLAACTSPQREVAPTSPGTVGSPTLGGGDASERRLDPEAREASDDELREFFAHLESDERDTQMRAALATNGQKVKDAITTGRLGAHTTTGFEPLGLDPSINGDNLVLYITEDRKNQVLVEFEEDGTTIRQFVHVAVFIDGEWVILGLDGRGITGGVWRHGHNAQSGNDSTARIAQRTWQGKADLNELKDFESMVLSNLANWTAKDAKANG